MPALPGSPANPAAVPRRSASPRSAAILRPVNRWTAGRHPLLSTLAAAMAHPRERRYGFRTEAGDNGVMRRRAEARPRPSIHHRGRKPMQIFIHGLIAGAALAALSLAGVAQAAWPERPVTIIVPAGAGGGTDATARLLAKQLQDELKQPFNVVNNGQGGGIVGHTQIATARPDGYTLGIVYNYYQWKMLGQADINHTLYTPIALYNVDPSALIVADTSPFKT
ncbi:MAG: hypothetical protein FJX57_15725, partial [Alphaproteobacteria bacterium]|nr:hypothetical protein [Alphaproteobacteria bacterium]